eukprot:gnl/MRDRNA2_/MRDRNA2_68510_c0_seq1.p1 gnl/MRDRNA2_/MRDRNA2_68510_c0~~gnl/MRDRNA2_/MRDRNA2_68510_c0_seq1.p1  ORF type:complete len:180 (+),score=31.70 gnl/MRDRNA2_/MRDRNA2_68510_c0_seq1:17-556(+)
MDVVQYKKMALRKTKSWILSKEFEMLPKEMRPLQCIQRAGEIIWLPESWYHATLNLEHSLSFGAQEPDLSTPVDLKRSEIATASARQLRRAAEGKKRFEDRIHLLKLAYRAEPFKWDLLMQVVNKLQEQEGPKSADAKELMEAAESELKHAIQKGWVPTKTVQAIQWRNLGFVQRDLVE